MSEVDLIQRLFDDDFLMLEGTRVELNVTVSAVPINAYLATLLNNGLRRLEIECLTDNQARVGVTLQLKKAGAVSRDFLVEIEGGVGPHCEEVLFLHIRKGFKAIDGLPLIFSNKLNQNLPDGLDFVREFRKDRFRVDLRRLFEGADAGHFFELIENFEVRTMDEMFHVEVAVAANRSEEADCETAAEDADSGSVKNKRM